MAWYTDWVLGVWASRICTRSPFSASVQFAEFGARRDYEALGRLGVDSFFSDRGARRNVHWFTIASVRTAFHAAVGFILLVLDIWGLKLWDEGR